jgi:hypothetical protein
MKVLYTIVGVLAIVFGIMSWCGFEMSPFAAGCYAFTAGIVFISEACKVK